MSLNKLSLARNNLIIPGQGEFGLWHTGWGLKNRKPFLQCRWLRPHQSFARLTKIKNIWSPVFVFLEVYKYLSHARCPFSWQKNKMYSLKNWYWDHYVFTWSRRKSVDNWNRSKQKQKFVTTLAGNKWKQQELLWKKESAFKKKTKPEETACDRKNHFWKEKEKVFLPWKRRKYKQFKKYVIKRKKTAKWMGNWWHCLLEFSWWRISFQCQVSILSSKNAVL